MGEARRSHIESNPRVLLGQAANEMRTQLKGQGRAANLNKVVAEGEEGVECADAEIRDVELRERQRMVRHGELPR